MHSKLTMEWDKESGRPVPGSYKVKDPALEKLLLDGWHREDPSGRNAEGILPYIVQVGSVGDPCMLSHYRDILDGHLVMEMSWPDREEVLCRLYFCDSEEDIWDMLKEGLGDTDSFIMTYAGYSGGKGNGKPGLTASPERLERFCRHMEGNDPVIRTRIEFIRSISVMFSPAEFTFCSITKK